MSLIANQTNRQHSHTFGVYGIAPVHPRRIVSKIEYPHDMGDPDVKPPSRSGRSRLLVHQSVRFWITRVSIFLCTCIHPICTISTPSKKRPCLLVFTQPSLCWVPTLYQSNHRETCSHFLFHNFPVDPVGRCQQGRSFLVLLP